jgi:choline monooxygenase
MAAGVLAEAELERIAEGLAQGYTLPASWYTDAAILALEQERVFARSWQYVGRLEQVAEPGDFFTGRAGQIPVVVVRDEDGRLNGFVNVCRHRGHEVAAGQGNRRTLQCPYHAWTYGLDGCLRAVPRGEREPDLPVAELSLRPVQVDSWGPFVFVNPDLDAEPFAVVLGELPAQVDASGADFSRLRFRERREWTLQANWKVGLENYLECYHCPVAHPGFSELLDVDPDQYRLTIQPWFSSQFGEVRASVLDGSRTAAYDPRGGEIAAAQYHFLWPNVTINIEAGRLNLSIDAWIPDGPQRMRGYSDVFFGEDVPEEAQQEIIAFGLQVGKEDDSLCESVQRGLSSGMVSHGRLLRRSEQLIAHFQGLVFAALAG